jgi:hypothetical protein
MRRSKHTEAAIIAVLKQVEAGRKVELAARSREYPSTRSMPGRPSSLA